MLVVVWIVANHRRQRARRISFGGFSQAVAGGLLSLHVRLH
jgi:hypothetical protein